MKKIVLLMALFSLTFTVSAQKKQKTQKNSFKSRTIPKGGGMIPSGCFSGHDSAYIVYKDSFDTLRPLVQDSADTKEKISRNNAGHKLPLPLELDTLSRDSCKKNAPNKDIQEISQDM